MNGDERIRQNRQELIALLDTILAKTADQAHEIDKALLTLSSGSLVISMHGAVIISDGDSSAAASE